MVLIASTVSSLSLSISHTHSLTFSLYTLSPIVSFSPFLSFVALRGKCFSAITFSKKKVRVSQQYKIKDGGFGELISYLSQINRERERECVKEKKREEREAVALTLRSSPLPFVFFSPPIMSFYIYFFIFIFLNLTPFFSYLYKW